MYRKDTEPLYHAFMYSPIILLSSIYPFTQCLSLLVTIILRTKFPKEQTLVHKMTSLCATQKTRLSPFAGGMKFATQMSHLLNLTFLREKHFFINCGSY